MEFLPIISKEALKSNMVKKIGAALIHRGKIISLGHNYHTVLRKSFDNFVSSIHAEQDCINNCKNKKLIPKSYIILVRCNSLGDIIPCEPCHTCQSIIEKHKVRKVVHV
jgi:tRNA(Arg) A34 adenosine deaminase TadA